uniref:Uncharacterized protein n=1 Tax=Litopenaeus vannamei majanivirus Nimav-1_LVa TaxID=2984273 RepID=A0A9C7BYT1_9VIRU|nr:MAG: hypothetical protein [Litopenaeus vannamei majanivirus Nimav-1_LVa]
MSDSVPPLLWTMLDNENIKLSKFIKTELSNTKTEVSDDIKQKLIDNIKQNVEKMYNKCDERAPTHYKPEDGYWDEVIKQSSSSKNLYDNIPSNVDPSNIAYFHYMKLNENKNTIKLDNNNIVKFAMPLLVCLGSLCNDSTYGYLILIICLMLLLISSLMIKAFPVIILICLLTYIIYFCCSQLQIQPSTSTPYRYSYTPYRYSPYTFPAPGFSIHF